MILTFFEYLYYRGVVFYSKHEDKNEFDDHKNRGTWISATYFFLNCLTVFSFVMDCFLFDLSVKLAKFDIYLYSIIGFYLLTFFSFMYFFEKKRHNQIFEKFSNEKLEKKKIRGALIILYFIISITLLTLSALPTRNAIMGN